MTMVLKVQKNFLQHLASYPVFTKQKYQAKKKNKHLPFFFFF